MQNGDKKLNRHHLPSVEIIELGRGYDRSDTAWVDVNMNGHKITVRIDPAIDQDGRWMDHEFTVYVKLDYGVGQELRIKKERM